MFFFASIFCLKNDCRIFQPAASTPPPADTNVDLAGDILVDISDALSERDKVR
jgi:hypothetical protein